MPITSAAQTSGTDFRQRPSARSGDLVPRRSCSAIATGSVVGLLLVVLGACEDSGGDSGGVPPAASQPEAGSGIAPAASAARVQLTPLPAEGVPTFVTVSQGQGPPIHVGLIVRSPENDLRVNVLGLRLPAAGEVMWRVQIPATLFAPLAAPPARQPVPETLSIQSLSSGGVAFAVGLALTAVGGGATQHSRLVGELDAKGALAWSKLDVGAAIGGSALTASGAGFWFVRGVQPSTDGEARAGFVVASRFEGGPEEVARASLAGSTTYLSSTINSPSVPLVVGAVTGTNGALFLAARSPALALFDIAPTGAIRATYSFDAEPEWVVGRGIRARPDGGVDVLATIPRDCTTAPASSCPRAAQGLGQGTFAFRLDRAFELRAALRADAESHPVSVVSGFGGRGEEGWVLGTDVDRSELAFTRVLEGGATSMTSRVSDTVHVDSAVDGNDGRVLFSGVLSGKMELAGVRLETSTPTAFLARLAPQMAPSELGSGLPLCRARSEPCNACLAKCYRSTNATGCLDRDYFCPTAEARLRKCACVGTSAKEACLAVDGWSSFPGGSDLAACWAQTCAAACFGP